MIRALLEVRRQYLGRECSSAADDFTMPLTRRALNTILHNGEVMTVVLINACAIYISILECFIEVASNTAAGHKFQRRIATRFITICYQPLEDASF